MPTVKPIPEGYHTVTPYLVVTGAAKLIDFMKQAFGAQELFRMAAPEARGLKVLLTLHSRASSSWFFQTPTASPAR